MECIKHSFGIERIKADSRVSYYDPYFIMFAWLGRDNEVTLAIVYGAHRLNGIEHEVQGYLLQLYAVTHNRGQIRRQLHPQCNLVSFDFRLCQGHNLFNGLVYVDRVLRRVS